MFVMVKLADRRLESFASLQLLEFYQGQMTHL